MSTEPFHPLLEAIDSANLIAIEQLAASGVDLNMRDEFGAPALFRVVSNAEFAENGADRDRWLEVIRKLVELGADLHALDAEGGSILIGPIFGLQTGLVEWLLKLGIDPNHGFSEPWETVYAAAIFDYHYEAFVQPSRPSLDPPDSECGNEDRFLAWVDRKAQERGYLRPEIPLLLRRFGALTGDEMAAKLGGVPGQRVRWIDGGWKLA
jgi:hypothetical protein